MSIPVRESWLNTPLGRYVTAWEQQRADRILSDVFGFNALQLGMPEIDYLRSNRIALRQRVDEGGLVDVRCDLQELPFASGSIDLVVLPHVLEFHVQPHQVLREVERVLIPEGQVLIAGFNPLSLWGVRRKLPGAPAAYPFDGRYIALPRLKDWLALLGMEVDRGHFGCYAPPLARLKQLERCRWMEKAGDRWWPIAGGVFMIRAVKRVAGMRIVKPEWKGRASARKKLAPMIPSQPTAQSSTPIATHAKHNTRNTHD